MWKGPNFKEVCANLAIMPVTGTIRNLQSVHMLTNSYQQEGCAVNAIEKISNSINRNNIERDIKLQTRVLKHQGNHERVLNLIEVY